MEETREEESEGGREGGKAAEMLRRCRSGGVTAEFGDGGVWKVLERREVGGRSCQLVHKDRHSNNCVYANTFSRKIVFFSSLVLK